MIDASWDVVFFGVFMLLNLLQTLLLTIFILKIKNKRIQSENNCSLRNNLNYCKVDLDDQPRYSMGPTKASHIRQSILATVIDHIDSSEPLNEPPNSEYEDMSEVVENSQTLTDDPIIYEELVKIDKNLLNPQNNGYMDMTQVLKKAQNTTDDPSIYEDLDTVNPQKVKFDENSYEDSHTYAQLCESTIMYDGLNHMEITSRKPDSSYETVKQ